MAIAVDGSGNVYLAGYSGDLGDRPFGRSAVAAACLGGQAEQQRQS